MSDNERKKLLDYIESKNKHTLVGCVIKRKDMGWPTGLAMIVYEETPLTKIAYVRPPLNVKDFAIILDIRTMPDNWDPNLFKIAIEGRLLRCFEISHTKPTDHIIPNLNLAYPKDGINPETFLDHKKELEQDLMAILNIRR